MNKKRNKEIQDKARANLISDFVKKTQKEREIQKTPTPKAYGRGGYGKS